MRVSAKQYAQVLHGLTDGKTRPEIEKAIADFARNLNKNRKLKLAGKIIEQFGKIYNKEKNIVEAEAISRQKIDETLEKKVKHFVKEKYLAKEVVLKNVIDKNIKGGIVLRVRDEVIDGSISGKLQELRKALI